MHGGVALVFAEHGLGGAVTHHLHLLAGGKGAGGCEVAPAVNGQLQFGTAPWVCRDPALRPWPGGG